MQARLNQLRRAAWGPLCLLPALVMASSVAHAGISVALQPATQNVDPGSEFDILVGVTQSGSQFNAFDAIVGFDPAALTLLRLTPLSLQEGALLTDACSNTFHEFRQGTDRDTITDVLLCSGVSVSGPGPIYKLHFRASSTPQATTVQFLSTPRFYNAGLYVLPVVASNAAVQIGAPAGVEDGVATPAGLRVNASPNPTRGSTQFRIESVRPGVQQLLILDTLGRVVRHLQSGYFEPRARTVAWDGRSDTGMRLPAGVYRVQLRAPQGVAWTRLTLLD